MPTNFSKLFCFVSWRVFPKSKYGNSGFLKQIKGKTSFLCKVKDEKIFIKRRRINYNIYETVRKVEFLENKGLIRVERIINKLIFVKDKDEDFMEKE